jgi:hypothetical protein
MRFVPPTVLIVLLTWFMVGCVYIPWFEQKNDPKQLDFRPLVGPSDSNKSLRVGHVTKEQVIKKLGEPMDESGDGTILVYGIDTFYGYWVAPFCFAADVGIQKGTVVRLQFDKSNLLVRYDLSTNTVLIRLFDGDHAQQRQATQELIDRGLPTPDDVLMSGGPLPRRPTTIPRTSEADR